MVRSPNLKELKATFVQAAIDIQRAQENQLASEVEPARLEVEKVPNTNRHGTRQLLLGGPYNRINNKIPIVIRFLFDSIHIVFRPHDQNALGDGGRR